MKKYKVKSFEFDVFTILLLVLTIVAFLIRVYQVDYLTLWVDEYVHVDRARYFPEKPLFTDDNNGILLTMFIIPFFKIFGTSVFWARFPSVVFGALLVPMIYLFVKKYFNRNAALLSAGLVVFSTYLVFWSRLARNYAIFTFFFLLFLYFFCRAIHADGNFKPVKNRFLNYLKLQAKYLWIALAVLFLSILSHQLTFLVVYGILFYYVLLFIDNLVHKRFNFLSLEAVITYLFFIFSVAVLIPSIQDICKSFFLLFLPQNIANWVLPDLDRLAELMQTQPYQAFTIYFDILKYDYHALYYLGFAGFICAIVRYRKSGYFITSIFVILFILMSFVFREPSITRYLIYIYPLFLIAIALACDTLIVLLRKMIKAIPAECLVVVCIVLFCFLPTAKASVAMVRTKVHGQVISRRLDASFYFPDWKTSLMQIKPHLGENDLLISTIPAYVNFYLDKDSYQFRQRRYDSTLHEYVSLPVDTLRPNANSTQAIKQLLDNADKAWLVVDYYFNNVMTDPQTKSYIVNRMKFEYDMSNEYVSVFSYDKTKPNMQTSGLFEYLHQEYGVTRSYQFENPSFNADVVLAIEVEGITRDNEMLVQLNGNYSLSVSKQNGALFRQTGDSKSRQLYAAVIPKNVLKQGINTFIIGLNSSKSYKKSRIVIYNIQFMENS